jgi:hypothetical protein
LESLLGTFLLKIRAGASAPALVLRLLQLLPAAPERTQNV